MALRLSTGLRQYIQGTGSTKAALADGIIEIYSGVQPSSADDAVAGTLLLTITESGGSFTPGSPTNGLEFGAPVAGVLGKASAETWQGDGVANGIAGWFRFKGNAADAGGSSTTAVRLDGSIGSSGADLNLGNTNIVIGETTTLNSFNLTLPASIV